MKKFLFSFLFLPFLVASLQGMWCCDCFERGWQIKKSDLVKEFKKLQKEYRKKKKEKRINQSNILRQRVPNFIGKVETFLTLYDDEEKTLQERLLAKIEDFDFVTYLEGKTKQKSKSRALFRKLRRRDTAEVKKGRGLVRRILGSCF